MALDIKAYDLKLADLKAHIKALKLLKPITPNHMVARVAETKLNYLNLGELKPGSELYILATPIPKRLETRFMLGGRAQNDYFYIERWRGNAKESLDRFKSVRDILRDQIPKATFTVNKSNHYLSTFDLPIFLSIFEATRLPAQSEQEIHAYLKELYSTNNALYHQGTGESSLSDSSFDNLRKYLISEGLVDSATVGAAPTPGTKKVTLSTPLGSLENAFNTDELKRFFRKYPANEKLIETNKIDGISGQVDYKKGMLQSANTKGNGYIGEDMTRLAKLVPDIPKKLKEPIDISIRSEFFIRNSVFNKKYGVASGREKPFKNARNMMAGLKNRSNPDPAVAKDVSVLGYGILNSKDSKSSQLKLLKRIGFPVVDFKVFTVSDTGKIGESQYLNLKADTDYDMDGLVYELDNHKYREDFIAGKIDPKFAVAFKPVTQKAQTVVRSIEYNISKDRYAKPTAYYDPVEVTGVTLTSVTLHNAKKVQDLGLGVGAVIEVQRSGDAIPHIVRVIKPAKVIGLPEVGRWGGWSWNSTGVDIVLNKGVESEEHEIEKINIFFSALNVERFSEGLIKSFYASGYKTIPDILHMTEEDILNDVPRQGKTSASNIIKEFGKLKNPGVKLPDLLYASGCFGRGLGKNKFTDLYAAYGDKLIAGWEGMRLDDIANSVDEVPGFSYDTGKQFALGIKSYLNFYKSVRDVIYVRKQEKPKVGSLSGQVVSVSEFRDKVMGQKIEALGGIYSESLTSKTTVLLVPGAGVTSKKTIQAKAKGIPVVVRADFVKKYGL